MNITAERLAHAMSLRGMKQAELCEATGIVKSSISTYLSGEYKPKQNNLYKIALALDVSEAWLMGCDVPMERSAIVLPNGLQPMPRFVRKPRVGTIACGEPILAVENIEGYDEVPDSVHCDFTLLCKGNSMINAHIQDGSIVYIRQQEDVENREIAAVMVNGEDATLKRVFKDADGNVTMLLPENPAVDPIYVTAGTTVKIIGKAVGFTSTIK